MEYISRTVEVNYTQKEKKVAALLPTVGDKFTDRSDQELPKDKSYTDFCIQMKCQFSRVPVFKEWTEFYNLRQGRQQTVRQWFTHIDNKSVDCKSGS